jgi:hypothetical protein
VARALKTWLGLRYDRPAIPQRFVGIYDELSRRVRKRNHDHRDSVRDILVSFAEADGTTFDLVAVLPADSPLPLEERAGLEDWLSMICLEIPAHLGVPTDIRVASTAEISMDFLENSYSLDVSYVTWPAKGGGPHGVAR